MPVSRSKHEAVSNEVLPWHSAIAESQEPHASIAGVHVLMRSGYWRAAEKYLYHLLQSTSSTNTKEESRGIHVYLGFVLSRRGEYERALKHYREYEALGAARYNVDRAQILNSIGNQYSGLGQWRTAADLYQKARALAPANRGGLYAEANLCVHGAHIGDPRETVRRCKALMERFDAISDRMGYYFVLSMQLSLAQTLSDEEGFSRLADQLLAVSDEPALKIVQPEVYDSIIAWHLQAQEVQQAATMMQRLRHVLDGEFWSPDGNWLLIREAGLLRVSGDPGGGLQLLSHYLPVFCHPITRIYGLAEIAHCARVTGDADRERDALVRSIRQLEQLGASHAVATRNIMAFANMGLKARRVQPPARLFSEYVGRSVAVVNLKEQLRKLAASECTILLTGPSGTGKTMIAYLIHGASKRAGRPFVRFDATCNDEGLLESVLFGHERGAFTGAVAKRLGLVEVAEGGTLFIDEVAELPLALQGKLLTLLEERQYRPVGSSHGLRANVRVVLATNRSLEAAVAAREFREDLFYRAGIEVSVPSLNERRGDINLLCEHFLYDLNARERTGKRFALGTVEAMEKASWPGNVRQLRRSIERGFYLSEDEIDSAACGVISPRAEDKGVEEIFRSLENVERDHILNALTEARGNKSLAARLLGVKRTTLYSRLQVLGLLEPR